MIFDTLAFAQRLKSVGFTDAQAETLAEANREMILQAISAQSARSSESASVFSEARTGFRAAIQEFGAGFRADLKEMEVRLTLRMWAIGIAILATVAAIIKL